MFQNKLIVNLTISILFFLSFKSSAQFYNLPNDYSFSLLTQKQLSGKDSSIHSGIQPYIHFFSDKYVHVADTHKIFKYITDDPVLDVAFFKHVISIHPPNQNFKFTLDPVLNVEIGNDYYNGAKKQTSTNSRGFIGCGYIGNKVYFETMFVESQSFFPEYVSRNVSATSIVPGQGRYKNFKQTGFDYAFSSGFVSFQALKNLNIQVGHGKQKIGHGYRSLLLSDNAFNYPYVRFTQQWFKGRVQYSNIYSVLMNLESASLIPNPNAERLFQKKTASFQYLSVNVTKFLNVAFFQGLIWQAGDNKNKQHLDWQYFNPIIYTNLPLLKLNNKNNIVAGGEILLKITNKINVYGQLMADDLSNTKTIGNGIGYQAGLKYFDVLGLKNLFFQAEYNNVSEASYVSPIGAITNQSYSHYNQNLAYTPGYGQEIMCMLDYKYKRLFSSARYQYQSSPQNRTELYNNQITNFKIGYLINPAYNLNVALGYTSRNQNFSTFNGQSNQTNYIYLALKTNFYNLYYDF